MDIKTSELILKAMLAIKQDDCLSNPIPDLVKALPDLSEDVILAAIAHFKRLGLINAIYGDGTVACIAVNASAVGHLRKLEEDRELRQQQITAAPIHQSINIKNNYGAAGTNTNFTINNSFDFAEFERLVKENTAENSIDRKEFIELQKQLQNITQHNIPISKGYLRDFGDVMQKHSWVTGQLAGFLIKWVTG